MLYCALISLGYLALGAGAASYLILSVVRGPPWFGREVEALLDVVVGGLFGAAVGKAFAGVFAYRAAERFPARKLKIEQTVGRLENLLAEESEPPPQGARETS